MLRRARLSRRRFLGGALAVAGAAVVGCGGGEKAATTPEAVETAAGGPKRGGTVRQAFPAVLGLDPHTVEGVSFAPNFYSYIVHATDWEGTVGDLAESWETVDELNWVFALRGGVRFHNIPPVDGREVVAEDFIHSADRLQNLPGSVSQWSEWLDRYEAPDARTLNIRTKRPEGYLLMTLGSPLTAVVPSEAVREFGDLRTNVIGSGPFMLSSFSRDEGFEAVRNPDYYRPEIPYIDGLGVRAMPDDSSMQVAFRAGSLDVYNAPDKLKADAVAGVSGVSVQPYLQRPYSVFELNGTKVAAFKDERVREAIDRALDRQAMIDKLHFGGGELAGPVGPVWDSALPPEEVAAAYVRDVAKAKQLLSAAGYEDLRFKLSFSTLGTNPNRAAIIQQNLADAGIKVDLEAGEIGAWLSDLLAGNFETTTYAHLAYLSDDIQLQSHHSLGWGRTEAGFRGVEDAQVDAMLDQIRETLDETERITLAQDVQRLILERHGPVLVLYQPYGYWCAYDYIKGYTPTAYGFGLYKYDFWIDKA